MPHINPGGKKRPTEREVSKFKTSCILTWHTKCGKRLPVVCSDTSRNREPALTKGTPSPRSRTLTVAFTCQPSGEPDGAGVRAGWGVGGQQVTEDGVRDKVEGVSRDVPQDHGPGPSVQPLEALGLQDAADAVDGSSVEPLAGDVDGAQRYVGAAGNVSSKV